MIRAGRDEVPLNCCDPARLPAASAYLRPGSQHYPGLRADCSAMPVWPGWGGAQRLPPPAGKCGLPPSPLPAGGEGQRRGSTPARAAAAARAQANQKEHQLR